MDDKYLARLGALLRQAESTTNKHEAEAFMAAAQRLSTATQIDLEVARQHQENKEKRESPIQRRISIGTSGKKGLKYYVRLFLAVAANNSLECNIASNSTAVYAFGFPSDIDMCELLYASLITQMIESSDRYLRSGEYKREINYRTGRPVDGRVARANFQEAFISAISTRLREARAEAIAEATANEPKELTGATEQSVSSSTEIVLKNKEIEVRDYYKETSKARGSWGGYRGSAGYSSLSRSAGHAAGQRARIGSQRAIGGN